ncbi:MAG: TRAP transporter TatT component family protein [Steroidobacterales bacterium]
MLDRLMIPGNGLKRVVALTLALAASACSIQRWAVDKAGDALASDSSVVARDDDPDFVRAAVPFSLELMESLLDQDPRHRGLLLATARGFTQYSYAFVQLDADMLEDQDYVGSARLRQRARRLYLRARDYGLRGLDAAHRQFSETLRRDPQAAALLLGPSDLPFVYWTAVAWAAAVSQAKDDPDMVGDLPRVDALAARASALDRDFGGGALQTFLISYEMAREARPDVARAHFDRAVSLSGGRSAAPYVALAESVCVAQRSRGEFLRLLDQALAIDPDRHPDNRLENLIVQRRARWLRERVDELFLPPMDTVQPEEKS